MKEHDTVRELSSNLNGTIVHVYPNGNTFEVELFDQDGNTIAVKTLNSNEISNRKTMMILQSLKETLRDVLKIILVILLLGGVIFDKIINRIAPQEGLSTFFGIIYTLVLPIIFCAIIGFSFYTPIIILSWIVYVTISALIYINYIE
jgi:flagellar biosynthesis protein FlhB